MARPPAKKRSFHQELVLNRWMLSHFRGKSLAVLKERPPSGEGWIHEIKHDGYRIEARIDERGESHLVDIVSDATRVQLRRIIKKMFDEEQKQPAPASAPTARVEIPITVAK